MCDKAQVKNVSAKIRKKREEMCLLKNKRRKSVECKKKKREILPTTLSICRPRKNK